VKPGRLEILDIDDTFCAAHGGQQLAFWAPLRRTRWDVMPASRPEGSVVGGERQPCGGLQGGGRPFERLPPAEARAQVAFQDREPGRGADRGAQHPSTRQRRTPLANLRLRGGDHDASLFRKNEPTVTISGKQWRARAPIKVGVGPSQRRRNMKIASTLSVAFLAGEERSRTWVSGLPSRPWLSSLVRSDCITRGHAGNRASTRRTCVACHP
jgi:hypothetical protein